MPGRTITTIAAALLFGAASATALHAEPLELGWADLIPESARSGENVQVLQGLIEHAQVAQGPEEAAGAIASIEELIGLSSPIAYRTDLEGQEVSLPGYIIPLALGNGEITGFLLVPYVGACIHVPAPPANQLVLVEYPPGFSAGLYAPVTVTGVLSVLETSTDLAEVGYFLDATRVELF